MVYKCPGCRGELAPPLTNHEDQIPLHHKPKGGNCRFSLRNLLQALEVLTGEEMMHSPWGPRGQENRIRQYH